MDCFSCCSYKSRELKVKEKILFVCGFNTCQEWESSNRTDNFVPETYKSIYNFVKDRFDIVFFKYKNHENLNDVIAHLATCINSYNQLWCHSMGGCLTSVLLSDTTAVPKEMPVVLLMPLVHNYNFILNFLKNKDETPDIEEDNFIKSVWAGLVAPYSSLKTKKYEWYPDASYPSYFQKVPTFQLLQSYHKITDKFNIFLQEYISRPKLYFVYASEELLNTLESNQISLLSKTLTKRFIITPGKHEVFNEDPDTSSNEGLKNKTAFFNNLNLIISSIKN